MSLKCAWRGAALGAGTQQSSIMGDLDEMKVTLQVLLDTSAGFKIRDMLVD